ncbi:MAG: hypothetical protein P8184_15060 [Calditrichia bacterium]
MRSKRFLFLSLVLVAIFIFENSLLASGFEGKIVQKNISVSLSPSAAPDESGFTQYANDLFSKSNLELKKMAESEGNEYSEETAIIYMKGKNYRIDTNQEGQKVSIIYNLDTKKMTTLQWASKTAMVTDMEQMGKNMSQMMGQAQKQMGDMDNQGMEEDNQFSMKSAGETKTINNFKCELYEGKDSDGDYTHLWLTKDDKNLFDSFMPIFSELDNLMQTKLEQGKEEQFYREKQGVPVLTKSISGSGLNIDEITDISSENVPADMFAVPADFKEVNMQQMIQEQMKKYQDMMNQQK